MDASVAAKWYLPEEHSEAAARLRQAWAAFEAAPVTLASSPPLLPEALEIAFRCGCTVYDALYVALASAREEEDAAMVTADRKSSPPRSPAPPSPTSPSC